MLTTRLNRMFCNTMNSVPREIIPQFLGSLNEKSNSLFCFSSCLLQSWLQLCSQRTKTTCSFYCRFYIEVQSHLLTYMMSYYNSASHRSPKQNVHIYFTVNVTILEHCECRNTVFLYNKINSFISFHQPSGQLDHTNGR